jgi:hypothetical protein
MAFIATNSRSHTPNVAALLPRKVALMGAPTLHASALELARGGTPSTARAGLRRNLAEWVRAGVRATAAY